MNRPGTRSSSIRPDGTILLAPPNPTWPDLYARESDRIHSILEDRVCLLEHVGSTAVAGLAAKPIIDLVLAVEDSADESSYVPDLEAHGYTLRIREPDWFEHRVLKGPDTDVNLHVFSDGAEEIERMILFRNHLRADAADRARYESVKRTLAARRWDSVQDYADAKSTVIEEIMARAAAGPQGPS